MEQVKLDPYTFGDSKAAINLADMLSKPEFRHCAGKVSSTLCHFNETMTELRGIKNVSVRVHIYHLVMEDAKRRAEVMVLPEIVKTHMLNVMMKSHKISSRDCNKKILEQRRDG